MWDIPNTTGLTVQPDILPTEPPTAFQKEMPLLAAETFSRQGNVAVIDINGVITPYQNILSMLFGGTDIASLEIQFEDAITDPDIDGIILRIDSPGGLITGVEELATTIASARGIKPIIAYGYGNAASAAYWIASAADKIMTGPTTMLGSIGVAMAVPKTRETAWVEFVSSNAPKKRLDPQTPEGQSSIQARLDAMEDEFVGAVARFRDVSTDEVLSEFGQGDVLPAREAVRAGMADLVGGMKDALSLITTLQTQTKGVVMTKKTETPETQQEPGSTGDVVTKSTITADYIAKNFPQIASALIAQGREEAVGEQSNTLTKESFSEGYKAGAEAERDRILGLEEVSMPGHEGLVEEAKKDGKTKASDLAMKIVAAEKQRGGEALKTIVTEAQAEPIVMPSVPETPQVDANAPIEERAEAEWKASADIRTEFDDKDTYIAFRKAEESGRVKRYAPRAK